MLPVRVDFRIHWVRESMTILILRFFLFLHIIILTVPAFVLRLDPCGCLCGSQNSCHNKLSYSHSGGKKNLSIYCLKPTIVKKQQGWLTYTNQDAPLKFWMELTSSESCWNKNQGIDFEGKENWMLYRQPKMVTLQLHAIKKKILWPSVLLLRRERARQISNAYSSNVFQCMYSEPIFSQFLSFLQSQLLQML